MIVTNIDQNLSISSHCIVKDTEGTRFKVHSCSSFGWNGGGHGAECERYLVEGYELWKRRMKKGHFYCHYENRAVLGCCGMPHLLRYSTGTCTEYSCLRTISCVDLVQVLGVDTTHHTPHTTHHTPHTTHYTLHTTHYTEFGYHLEDFGLGCWQLPIGIAKLCDANIEHRRIVCRLFIWSPC